MTGQVPNRRAQRPGPAPHRHPPESPREPPLHAAHTCTSCGFIQSPPTHCAQCVRCGFRMTHTRAAGPLEAFFWSFALLALFAVLVPGVFMAFTFAGGANRIAVGGGALEVIRHCSLSVGIAVLYCSLVSPVLWGLGMLYVSGGLLARAPAPCTAAVLRLLGRLRPWVMPEVFLLGVLVAHGKLSHEGSLGYGQSFYLYVVATGVWVVIGLRIKDDRLWARLGPGPNHAPAPGSIRATPNAPHAGCQTCGLVQHAPHTSPRCELTCARCHAPLHESHHAALRRSAGLLLIAMLLLVPANTVPIMRIAQLGPPEPATVWGGIKVLHHGGSPALAAVVFAASLCVPLLKVLVLAVLVLCRHPRRAATARRMAKTHRLVATLGRWSMVDMFVIALLIGLVQLGSLASVSPQAGALAFLAVVVLTMVAAEDLNPRLFWDRTEDQRNA